MREKSFHEKLIKKLQESFEQTLDYKIKMGQPIVISNEKGEAMWVSAQVAKAIYDCRKDELLEIIRNTDDEKLRNYILGRVPNDEWEKMLDPDEFDRYITSRHNSLKS